MQLTIKNADQLNVLAVALDNYIEETKTGSADTFPHRNEMLAHAFALRDDVQVFENRLREFKKFPHKQECICWDMGVVPPGRHTLCSFPHDIFDGTFTLKAVK